MQSEGKALNVHTVEGLVSFLRPKIISHHLLFHCILLDTIKQDKRNDIQNVSNISNENIFNSKRIIDFKK